eukprot:gene6865-4910_t
MGALKAAASWIVSAAFRIGWSGAGVSNARGFAGAQLLFFSQSM